MDLVDAVFHRFIFFYLKLIIFIQVEFRVIFHSMVHVFVHYPLPRALDPIKY